jgi:hypothetical protein
MPIINKIQINPGLENIGFEIFQILIFSVPSE